MESRRDLRVLPSNAPILAENGNVLRSPPGNPNLHTSPRTCPKFNNGLDCRVCGLLHACSTCLQDDHNAQSCKKGILRASSGNIVSDDFTAKSNDSKSKVRYASTHSRTTVEGPDSVSRHSRKLEHRKRQRGYLNSLPLFYRSELLSPRYNAYRAKIRSKGPDTIWPDPLEEAFQEALRLYPRRGRKKEMLDGKQSGGNEFITAHILKRTGILRTRKQISSHIQVLKAKLCDNIAWMSLMIANGLNNEDEKKQDNAKQIAATNRLANNSADSHYAHVAKTHQRRAPPSSTTYAKQHQYPTIRGVEFSMTLYKGSQDSVSRDTIHDYTSIQSEMGSAPWPLEDLKGWRTMYPPLAEYHNLGQIDCPIYLFDTNLNLMESAPQCPAALSIECNLDVAQGVDYTNWQSFARFFEEKGHPVDLVKFYKHDRCREAWLDLEASQGARKGDCKLHGVPLKSKWWARTFSNMVRRICEAKATGDAQAVAEEEDNTERYLRGISVMQEIHASSHVPGAKAERIAILLWKFRRVRKGEAATTDWRMLIPPVSPFQIQSPTPPLEQPPLTLDTTLHSTEIPHPAPSYTDFYNPQQPSIFADNAEELLDAEPFSDCSSRATTPPSDYTSFPSSTSTSFPSNLSNSSYQPHLMQDPSFQSQDSVYPPLGSFSSQESQYHSHELIAQSQDIYDPQEAFYHPQQDPLYPQTTTQLYDWPTPQTLLPDDTTAMASQDLTAGKIQISYSSEAETSFAPQQTHPAYEPHLFAPRAHTTPHHQLIQHPEHFEPHDYPTFEGNDLDTLAAVAGQAVIEETEQHCNIDWQLIASQPIPVADLRFHEEGEAIAGDVVQRYEEWRDGHAVSGGQEEVEQQGEVLGEVIGEIGEEGLDDLEVVEQGQVLGEIGGEIGEELLSDLEEFHGDAL